MKTSLKLLDLSWEKHPANPVLPPREKGSVDSTACMNPFAMVDGDRIRLFYAGGDDAGQRHICVATAAQDDLTTWERQGPLLELGKPGAFDQRWTVLPYVHRFGDRWHLYYSGNEGSSGLGLQGFPGIGLAISEDGEHFEKYSEAPVITGDQTAAFPDNRGIAGGGTILEDVSADGGVTYRMYYTLATGTPSHDRHIDQEKYCAVCFSRDGIHWTDHRIVLGPRSDVPHDDVAGAAPFVWHDGDCYRMIYSAIGTRWDAYSLAQAVSADGFIWERGPGDSNLVLMPDFDNPDSWEHQMVEYPSLLIEGDHLRLFYCGNGYGRTGIGTATAKLMKGTS